MEGFYLFLRFASNFYVLSRILWVVVVVVSFSRPRFVCCWVSLPRAMAVFQFNLEPWLARSTCIYGFGNGLFSPCTCRMSVQSFGRLEWSNALGTCSNALLSEPGLSLLLLATYDCLWTREPGELSTSAATKNLGWNFIVILSRISYLSVLFRNQIAFHRI